jgi:Arc/MetJ-type ribon-helix-helix transcriptional regulator
MKTTFVLPAEVVDRLRAEATRTGRTMSNLVEAALRRLLEERPEPARLPTLPSFSMGPASVDIADRDALYDAMESR